jgi:hypothetical protein
VLSAESGVLRQRSLGVDLQARLLDTQVSLAKALGGSLEAPAASSAAAVTTTVPATPSQPVGTTATAPIASPSQAQRVALSGDRS